MCGVSALITRSAVDLKPCIDAMTDSLAHRGPDDQGFFSTRQGEEVFFSDYTPALLFPQFANPAQSFQSFE